MVTGPVPALEFIPRALGLRGPGQGHYSLGTVYLCVGTATLPPPTAVAFKIKPALHVGEC